MPTRILAVILLLSQTAFAQRQIRLQGDTCSLHFTVFQYFPMIDATVNGIKGKMMFDTGNENALSLNDHLVKQTGGKKVGRGFTGSGQSFDVNMYDTIQEVKIGDRLKYSNSGPVIGNNMDFLEAVTPDYLGFVGHYFFDGYLFKLDYKKGLISFYKFGNKDFLKGEKVIAVLDFETGKLPNHPMIHIKVGGVDMLGLFDTGQLGDICLSDSVKKVLTENKTLILSDKPPLASLIDIELAPGVTASIPQLHSFPAAKASGVKNALGISAENILDIGYGFLAQYKTVWDYKEHKLYLLENQ